MQNFERDLSASAKDFLRVVWPAIKKPLGGGELIPMEGVTDSNFARRIDISSGIDYWHFSDDQMLRGLACRVQWADRSYRTFTVRYSRDSGTKTEYAKRSEAIHGEGGWLYPHLTVQAFLSPPRGQGALINVAIVPTKDLINACEGIASCSPKYRNAGGIRRTSNAQFVYVNWDFLASAIIVDQSSRQQLVLCNPGSAVQ